ncbi:MAG: class I SAM-dependent methyltransferase [Ilumatobacteraceae bacterium]|jgi:SAM-dependent methyltransferase|nr:class I SAM-dependent methyltransferase [Ilumatobacteraceae bacterium]
MKQTGERPIKGSTPGALVALHDAGYREVVARLGRGVVVDIGCGVGDETGRLTGPGRVVVGIDYDWESAHAASAHGVQTTCADGAVLPLRGGAAQVVCSSHIIEHFVDPTDHVSEMARITADDGAALIITPNAPADFENPFHVHLFTSQSLNDMLGRHFEEVKVWGLDGDEEVRADFAARRRTGARLLALDVFGLRHRLPRGMYVGLHSFGRRLVYPFTNRREQGKPQITSDRFSIVERIDDDTLVLFAVAQKPIRR